MICFEVKHLSILYLQCGRANMETLTLARYILEMSLMEYDFVHRRESEMAAASLCLALRMKKAGDWVSWKQFILFHSVNVIKYAHLSTL